MRPAGLAVDHRGDLYISSDENNKVVLVVSPASTTDARPVPAGEDRSALLMQNSPNPFSGVTSIRFRLSRPEQVTLRIYDARGELVSTLVDGVCDVGEHTVPFEAAGLPSGVYLYRLRTGAMEQQRSMVLFR
jgi:DNA-binding beta-propeller fold protein YncE